MRDAKRPAPRSRIGKQGRANPATERVPVCPRAEELAIQRIRLILRFVVIGAVIGAGYGYWTSIAAAAGLRGLIRGALTGVLIGASKCRNSSKSSTRCR